VRTSRRLVLACEGLAQPGEGGFSVIVVIAVIVVIKKRLVGVIDLAIFLRQNPKTEYFLFLLTPCQLKK
jgi:hypothetical protein